MPYGDWINELPTAFFMVVHIAAFAVGAGFAWVAYKRDSGSSAPASRSTPLRSSST